MDKKTLLREMESVLRSLLQECRIPAPETTPVAEWVIYGQHGLLNSLQLMQLVVDLEERYLQLSGNVIVIASAKALSHQQSPFRTLDTLADYILSSAHA